MSDINQNAGGASRPGSFGDAGRVADREIGSAREQMANAGQSVREQAGQFAEGAKQKAADAVEDGKSRAAGSLDDFTAAIRKASDELGDRDQSMAARLVREAASGLEQASNSIKGSSVNDLVRTTGDFARRQPGAFLVGAALAGVALGRFLRASSDHSDTDRLRETTGLGTGRGDWRGEGTGSRTIPSDGLNHTRDEAPLTRGGSSALAPDASTSYPRGSATPGPVGNTQSGFGSPAPSGSSFDRSGSVGSTTPGSGTGSTGTSGLPTASALGSSGSSGTTGTRDLSSTTGKDVSDER